jgi:hypothetical protein
MMELGMEQLSSIAGPAGRKRTMGKRERHLRLVRGKKARQRCTLLELVRRIQDTGRDDDEVVAIIARLIESGSVVLCGTSAGAANGRQAIAANATATAVNNGRLRVAR